ncbi:MAG: Uma2 family endonuclease [Saprospiraceae bacterium]|nr:Uma2 family endonuclease [Saprospiraceae bacterium]
MELTHTMPDIAEEPRLYTVEEYLAMEELAEEKHEYDNGKINTMAGGTYTHNLISANCIREVSKALRSQNKPCVTISSDMKIYIAEQSKYFYADGSVVCGKPQFQANREDVLENPTLIIEVASDSTELFDRTTKFSWYSTIPSFKEYVLVSQKEYHVEVWTFVAENIWEVRIYKNLSDKVLLKTIDCEINLGELYSGITF